MKGSKLFTIIIAGLFIFNIFLAITTMIHNKKNNNSYFYLKDMSFDGKIKFNIGIAIICIPFIIGGGIFTYKKHRG